MTGLIHLTRQEFRLMLRDPATLPIVLGIPIGVLVAFGAVPSSRQPWEGIGGARAIDTVLPSLCVAIALAVLAFFTLPAYLGTYREKGILRRMSTTPAHPAGLLVAQLVTNLALALVAVALVLGVGVAALDMALPRDPVGFVASLVLGVAGLFSLGLLVAAVAPTARAASGYGMVLFFPSLFLAGVYLPKHLMPPVLARVGEFTPLGAFRTVLEDAWGGNPPDLWLYALLAVVAVGATALATSRFRWE
jgi:ABC-2 type transport system permease protein